MIVVVAMSVITMVTVVSMSVIIVSPAVIIMSPAMITIIFMPMITISCIMAIADDSLVPAAPEACIPRSYIGVVQPWVRLVYYYLISMIHIIVSVWAWQISCMDPGIITEINILMSRNIIISIHIGDVIIINMIVTYRTPFRLCTNIYT